MPHWEEQQLVCGTGGRGRSESGAQERGWAEDRDFRAIGLGHLRMQ